MPLTDLAVRKATPQAKPYKLSDADGMFLFVTPAGGRHWRLKYRFLGKEKLFALGSYPEVSLARAREKRHAARQLLDEGVDPAAQRRADKREAVFAAASTFRAVAEEWHAVTSAKWSAGHAEKIWRRLELHLFPELEHRPIGELKAIELLTTIRKVEQRKTTEMAHRLMQDCHAICRYAVITERASYNPAADLRGALVPHVGQHYPTIDAGELPAFFVALARVKTSEINRLAIKLLLYTFVRQGELRVAKWSEIDWAASEWRIPPEHTKMGDRHVVPLAPETQLLLRQLHTLTGHGALLFPSQHRRKHAMMSENTVNKVLRQMGYKGRLVGHGVRSLASTTLNEMEFAPDVIERQLAHRERNKVRAAYNRAEYLPQRHEMMRRWATFLADQEEAAVVEPSHRSAAA